MIWGSHRVIRTILFRTSYPVLYLLYVLFAIQKERNTVTLDSFVIFTSAVYRRISQYLPGLNLASYIGIIIIDLRLLLDDMRIHI